MTSESQNLKWSFFYSDNSNESHVKKLVVLFYVSSSCYKCILHVHMSSTYEQLFWVPLGGCI